MATKAKINKTAQQINTILTKADNIVTDGNGSKYLGDDGNYHNTPSGSGSASGTSIDDTTTSNASTWSSNKIHQEIEAKTVSQSQINSAVNSYLTENPVTAEENPWKNKRCVFLGDSMTEGVGTEYGKRYFEYLKKLKGIDAHGYGVNGAVYTGLKTQAEYAYQSFGTDIDAIFVWAGTNDYAAGEAIGNFFTTSDGVRTLVVDDTTTFKGCMNYLFNYLKKTFPDTQIIVMTPIHRAYAKFGPTNIQLDELNPNNAGLYIEDYVKAIREACDVWSLPCIDLYSDSGLYPLYSEYQKYFNSSTDKLHPNALGHQRIACTINEHLNMLSPLTIGSKNVISSMTINDITVKYGDVQRINVSMTPSDCINYNFTYTTDNPSVVMVDGHGALYGSGVGSANITVKDTASNISKVVPVTVTARTSSDMNILCSNLTHFSDGNNVEFQNAENAPWGIAVDFDSTNKTSICSGKTINRIAILVTNDGDLTIGKGSLSQYGSSYFSYTSKGKYPVKAGFNMIDVNIQCGANETILIGEASDDTTNYYSWSGGGLTDDEFNSFLVLSNKKMRQGSSATASLHGALYSYDGTDTPQRQTFTVTKSLTNATVSNSATSVTEGNSYTASITANTGYTLGTISVTMGGTDVTSTAYSNGTVTISNVTGNIVITASATANTYNVTKSATNCTITGNSTATHGTSYTATITVNDGYALTAPTVTMGGATLSNVYSNGTITISNVTGAISITANATEVSSVVNATGITLSPTAVSFDTAGDTSTITATLAPSNTTDTVVSWTSNNTAVATVDNGVITAVANGSATITAKTSNDLTATVSVTVNIATSGGDEPSGSTVFYASKVGTVYSYKDGQSVTHNLTCDQNLSSEYPYITISTGYADKTRVFVIFSNAELKVYGTGFKIKDTNASLSDYEVYSCVRADAESDGDKLTFTAYDSTNISSSTVLWANYDVYNSDKSSVVLAKNYNQSDYE